MDGDLLSPKRKRSVRATPTKKSSSFNQQNSKQESDGVGPLLVVAADGIIRRSSSDSSIPFVAHEESVFLDNSPIKTRRYSGPTTRIKQIERPPASPGSSRGTNKCVPIGKEQTESQLANVSTPPRSLSSSFTHNTTFDSSSIIRRCDDTNISSLPSPGSPHSSCFMKEGATERKTCMGNEERDWSIRESDTGNTIIRTKLTKSDYGGSDLPKNITASDYSPVVISRKVFHDQECNSSSSAGMQSTVFKRPNFTCPGSENLRHAQQIEDEWRSSFEGEDGESDEEEKSGQTTSCMADRMKLTFSTRPLFESENSVKSINSRFSDDDEHQQMDSNMSSMALHVGKDIGQCRAKSRTIFDCEPPSTDDCGPQFLARRTRGGRNHTRDNPRTSRENPHISDSCTSFVDALASSGGIGYGCNDDVYSNRGSFSTTIPDPFASDDREEVADANSSQFDLTLENGKADWNSSPTQSNIENDKSRGGRGYNLFASSSGSPSAVIHTPARSAGAAAAGMGDLGTPVTEVGSPADIDMGAGYDPCVNGEDSEDEVGHIGVFGFRTSVQSARHEEAFIKGRMDGRRHPDKSHFKLRADASKAKVLSCLSGSGLDGEANPFRHQGSSFDLGDKSTLQHPDVSIQREGFYDDYKSASTDKEFSQLDGIYQQSNAYSSKNEYSFTPNKGANGSGSTYSALNLRPQPDQSAFSCGGGKGGGTGLGCPSTPMRGQTACPATPMRTPPWAAGDRAAAYLNSDDDRDCRISDRDSRADGMEQAPLITRHNSLTSNKVLLSLSDTLDPCDVSFHRDFEQEGFLGEGTFANVYRAREKDGKSYAVKKSKRQFRSKKDRHLLMGEVLIMKKLGDVHCEYIVQLIRAWQEEGYFYVQIDLAERGTLKDLLIDLAVRNAEPDDSTVWHILHDVTCGLQHIHKCGIVHLDVKPANLLISMGGVIKIGDFGTAAELGKGEDGHEGDTRYMAIELLDSSDRYPSADIFSLGLTLYETCISCTEKYREAVGLGQSPLPNEGPFWHVLREGNAPDLPGRDAALCDIIKQAMSLLPADRPTTNSILAVPQVRDIALHRKPDIIMTAAAALALEPHQLARAASFIESMSAIHRTSLQLLKAGKSPLAVLVPPEDHERASTPTASNGGSVSFWQPFQSKTWEDPDKSEESTTALPIESSMEYAPALTCISLAPQRGLRDALGPPDHTISAQDLTENAVLLDTSVASKYESTDWTLLSPSPSSPVHCWLNTAMKSRPGALSFPLPGGSRRRNKIYTDNEQFGKAKSSSTTASTSPSRQASFRDSIQSCPLATPIPTIAKYRYADSSTNSSCGPSSNTRSSITVGNGYGSTGMGSYRPMVPLGGHLQGGQRTMSGSLRRAGLETLSSGKEQSRGGQ